MGVSGFRGLRPQTPTGALPLDPAGGLLSPGSLLLFLRSKFLATPLVADALQSCRPERLRRYRSFATQRLSMSTSNVNLYSAFT